MKLAIALSLLLPSSAVALFGDSSPISRGLKKGGKAGCALSSEVTGAGKKGGKRGLKGKKGEKGKKGKGKKGGSAWNRVSFFPACTQIDATCDTDVVTVAEIVAASKDGMTLIYTDSPRGVAGFIDIMDPSMPAPLGTIDVGGEPTSVAVKGDYALVAVNTRSDYVNVSGHVSVIDIESQTIVATIQLGGQPDSIAVSPDNAYAVVAIENERNEDLGDGEIPQMPPGTVAILVISDPDPSNWSVSFVDVTGLDGVYEPSDPEPEFVDINSRNVAVVTLQENNAVVLIDVPTGTVLNSFTAGTVDLTGIDATKNKYISQTESLSDIPREPDGVTWIGETGFFATADEGDMLGGSRGFTVFDACGTVVWTSGNQIDQVAAAVGHHNEDRAAKKGSEPENIEYAHICGVDTLFVNSERSSIVLVYDVSDPTEPVLQHVLPAGTGPEGGKAIPSRGLYVVASEVDDRDVQTRGGVNIYQCGKGKDKYPAIVSDFDEATDAPIGWGALSGLAAHPLNKDIMYTVQDSFYIKSTILEMNTKKTPARITKAIKLIDSNDVLASFSPYGDFSADDLAALINDDKTVNLDLEGVAYDSQDDTIWVVSEGSGTVGQDAYPIKSLNFLINVALDGAILEVLSLPDELNDKQVRYGFEGVTVAEDLIVAVVQRAWTGDANPMIVAYDKNSQEWIWMYYPLDAVESQNGGWVGLSEISWIPGTTDFLVVERDNKGGPDAAIKRIYKIDPYDALPGDTIAKELFVDLLPLLEATGSPVPEKIEGMAITAKGEVYIVNDNDGVSDNSGLTLFLEVAKI